jgi:hypothetical protein
MVEGLAWYILGSHGGDLNKWSPLGFSRIRATCAFDRFRKLVKTQNVHKIRTKTQASSTSLKTVGSLFFFTSVVKVHS